MLHSNNLLITLLDSTINLPSTDSCDAVKLQQEPKRQKLNESEFHFTVPESNLDPVCVWIFLGSEQKSKKFDKSDMNPNDWILLLKDSFQIHEWTLYMDFGTNTATGRKITNGLAQLFYDQNRCDVNFHFKGGQIIGAHILILSAGSPVFSAMFQSCFLESQTRKVNIEDIDPEVFRQLLICLYTGKAPKLAENSITQSLYQAADKYGVDTLKDECVSVLLTNLSSKNAVEILTRSHFHSIPNLFEEAMKCLVNNFREICSQPEWMDLIMKYPNLCLQVNQRLAFLLPPPKKITF